MKKYLLLAGLLALGGCASGGDNSSTAKPESSSSTVNSTAEVASTSSSSNTVLPSNLFAASAWANGGEEVSDAGRGMLYEWHNNWDWTSGATNVNTTTSKISSGFQLVFTQEKSATGNFLWYSQQVFYHIPSQQLGDKYETTMKIYSTVAGSITVNDAVKELVVGDNTITTTRTIAQGTTWDSKQYVKAAFGIQFGVDGVTVVESGTFVFSDINIKKLN